MMFPGLKNRYIRLLFFLAVLFSCNHVAGQGFTTKGTDFWLGFMENYLGDDTTGSDKMSIYITTDNLPASGTVSVPLGGWSQNYTVAPNSTALIIVPTALAMCTATETIENKGIHVTSDNPVSVYELNYVQYTSDANIIIPTVSLGKKYRVTTYKPSNAQLMWTEVSVSEFVVVAAYNNTMIKITPKCNTEGGHGANVPFTITLSQGEAYQVRAYFSSTNSLTGSLIEIDTTATDNCKTFAVFAGNKCAFVPGDSCCCNHICEQMMPINTWGKKYITVPLKDRASDVFRIVASQNGTIFTVNGGAPQGLNAGSFYEMDVGTPNYIDSNKPISVCQFSKSANTDGNVDSDPFMIMINPLEQTINRIVFNSFVTPIISNYYVNIVAKTAYTNLINLDGVNIASSFTPVPANTTYSYAQMSINQGNHILVSDSGLIANVYGYGWYETYGYIAGATVKNLDYTYDIITPTDTLVYSNFTDTICKGTTLAFSALANPYITDYSWGFGDGSAVIHGQTVSHTYNNPGTFTLTYYYQRNGSCGLDSIVWVVNVKCCNPLPGITATSQVCIGVNSTIQDTSTLIPTATYNWDFSGGNIVSGSGQGPYQVNWANPGVDTLWVVVSDPGCTPDSTFTIITVSPIPTSPFTVLSPLCYGVATTVNYTGNGSASANYQWNFGGGNILAGTGQGPYTVNWTQAGVFNVSLIVTENGCSSATTTLPVTIFPPPVPSFTANPQTTFLDQQPDISFIDSSSNTISWLWNFGDTISGSDNNSSLVSPTHTYTAEGIYTVWLIATSPDGCIDSTSLDVHVIDLHFYAIPNAFTPDGNGLNDIFQPSSTSFEYFYLYIFDRWGDLVFGGSDLKNLGWDGTYRGVRAKQDVYVWYMIYKLKDMKEKIGYGDVTLIR